MENWWSLKEKVKTIQLQSTWNALIILLFPTVKIFLMTLIPQIPLRTFGLAINAKTSMLKLIMSVRRAKNTFKIVKFLIVHQSVRSVKRAFSP